MMVFVFKVANVLFLFLKIANLEKSLKVNYVFCCYCYWLHIKVLPGFRYPSKLKEIPDKKRAPVEQLVRVFLDGLEFFLNKNKFQKLASAKILSFSPDFPDFLVHLCCTNIYLFFFSSRFFI